MKKSDLFTFDIDMYFARVHIAHNISTDEIEKYVSKNFPGLKYKRPAGKSAFSFTVEAPDQASQYVIDFIIPLKKNSPVSQRTISHEAYHIAQDIADTVGIKMDYNNQEPHAYLLGHIVEKINEKLFVEV